jgi:hypothetical protein
MPVQASKVVRNGVEDSFEDYADLLEEIQVQPSAQEEVFELIKHFRDKAYNLGKIRTGSEAAHRYINSHFFLPNIITKLGQIEMLSGPLKNLMDKDMKDEAMAWSVVVVNDSYVSHFLICLNSVTPVMNRLWSRMRDKIFHDPAVSRPQYPPM